MGVCRECTVMVNGEAGVRACMTVDTLPGRGSQT